MALSIFLITLRFASQTNCFNQIIVNSIILLNNINQKADIDSKKESITKSRPQKFDQSL